MEITDLTDLVVGDEYVIFIKPDNNYSINESYNNLAIGTYDGIVSSRSDHNRYIKMSDVLKQGFRRMRKLYYPASLRDVLLIKNPTTDAEYTEMVNIIENQRRGAMLNMEAGQVIETLKGTYNPSAINKNHFTYAYPPPDPVQETNDPPEDCPICHQTIEEDGIKAVCGHKFHRDCILRTILRRGLCPVCNRQFMPPYTRFNNTPPPIPIEVTNDPPEDCPICFETIKEDGIKTICGHKFHGKCIEGVRNNTCPMCRTQPMKPFTKFTNIPPSSDGGGKSRRKKRVLRRTKKHRNKRSKKNSRKISRKRKV